MLISSEQFNALALLGAGLVFGPAIAGIVWINRHAAWFRSLRAGRQLLLAALAPMGWILLTGVPLLNYRAWLDVARVWLIRDAAAGVSKEDLLLIGSTRYRFVNGSTAVLRADASHYQMIVNDSAHTLHRRSVFYGDCTAKSPYTLGAILGAEADIDIPGQSVLDNPSLGYFGADPDHPPEEITLTLPRPDDFARCEQVYWYAPLLNAPAGQPLQPAQSAAISR